MVGVQLPNKHLDLHKLPDAYTQLAKSFLKNMHRLLAQQLHGKHLNTLFILSTSDNPLQQ